MRQSRCVLHSISSKCPHFQGLLLKNKQNPKSLYPPSMLESFQTPKRCTPHPPFTRTINPWAESGAVQGEHLGEHYYFRTKHYKGRSTRGNAENANDALCIFEGIENRFRGHLLSNMAHRRDFAAPPPPPPPHIVPDVAWKVTSGKTMVYGRGRVAVDDGLRQQWRRAQCNVTSAAYIKSRSYKVGSPTST